MKTINTTKKGMLKEFLRYVVPSATSMIVFSTYTIVDGIFVARGVGELALAAVNLTMPFVNGMFALAILLSVGTSTVCAIHLGKGERAQANRIFTQNLVVLGTLAVLFTLAVRLFGDKIALFLGATEGTAAYVESYLRIVGSFAFAFMVSYNLEVLIKTGGHPLLSALGVGLCCVTNIVLDYVFVIKMRWGVEGAAYATGIAQTASLLLFSAHFLLGKSGLSLVPFKPFPAIYKRIVTAGSSNFLEELSLGFTAFLLNRALLACVGEVGLVAYAVIGYVGIIVTMTMMGITHGMQPLVSLSLGKGDLRRCRIYYEYALISVALCSLIFFAMCRLFPEWITLILIKPDSSALPYTVDALKAYSTVFLFAGANIAGAGFFAAMERPAYAMGISFFRGFVSIAAVLAGTAAAFGGAGIWYAPSLNELLCLTGIAVLTRRFFRRYPTFSEGLGPVS